MMLSVPTFIFYVATVLMAIVCGALLILIFYLVGATRAALRIINAVEESGRQAGRVFKNAQRMFELALVLFDFKE